jgi:hypothetical protein
MRALLGAALVSAGCSHGHAYHKAVAKVDTGAGDVALSVLDRRPDVLSGDEDENWVGQNRGGYGNPIDVETETDNPLAADFGTSACNSLDAAGFKCTVVSTRPNRDVAAAHAALAATRAPRQVLIVLNRWKADSYQYGWLHYDASIRVHDAAGTLLGVGRVRDTVETGGSVWNPVKAIEEAIPGIFEKRLEEILNLPEVAAALH